MCGHIDPDHGQAVRLTRDALQITPQSLEKPHALTSRRVLAFVKLDPRRIDEETLPREQRAGHGGIMIQLRR